MYRKSFFLVILSLLVMGLLFNGARMVAAIPGVTGMPSSYDPKISVDEAVNTSPYPLLIEFYTDPCGTCKIVTPWVHKLHEEKYKDKLTFVMVDVNKPENGQFAQIFGIQYVPAIFVFDFKNMSKAQVDIKSYGSKENLDKAISKAMKDAKEKAKKRAAS
jgi:thioredoxin-like negative regulator of GroEL